MRSWLDSDADPAQLLVVLLFIVLVLDYLLLIFLDDIAVLHEFLAVSARTNYCRTI